MKVPGFLAGGSGWGGIIRIGVILGGSLLFRQCLAHKAYSPIAQGISGPSSAAGLPV